MNLPRSAHFLLSVLLPILACLPCVPAPLPASAKPPGPPVRKPVQHAVRKDVYSNSAELKATFCNNGADSSYDFQLAPPPGSPQGVNVTVEGTTSSVFQIGAGSCRTVTVLLTAGSTAAVQWITAGNIGFQVQAAVPGLAQGPTSMPQAALYQKGTSTWSFPTQPGVVGGDWTCNKGTPPTITLQYDLQ